MGRSTHREAEATGVIVYGDIRDLTATRLLADLGKLPAVIVGSPPCQDASVANACGRGVDGERTGLFFEAIRLVDEIRPIWACFENVPGLRARGADRVLAALEALGYACWPLVVGAWHAGAPHRRNRVWIVAADADGGELRQQSRRGCGSNRTCAAQSEFASAADLSGDGRRPGRTRRPDSGDPGQREPVLQVAADADADGGRQPQLAQRDGEPIAGFDGALWHDALRLHDAGDADGARLPIGEGQRGDACEELPPALRAVGEAWRSWGEPLAGHLRVADGIPSGVARKCISAYGDAVVPQITEAIGSSMMQLAPTDGTVLDLFCGAAGGWSLGMHRAGYHTVAACEIDDWRREVFLRRFR